jgi:hypothetical protein
VADELGIPTCDKPTSDEKRQIVPKLWKGSAGFRDKRVVKPITNWRLLQFWMEGSEIGFKRKDCKWSLSYNKK